MISNLEYLGLKKKGKLSSNLDVSEKKA